ncbi:MAG TPA: hypothetical protein VEY91_08085 [Candidatus Limnocylindria bacterium]|nr:hypothetical protein [Candidatus Limnocylindria bacterium]
MNEALVTKRERRNAMWIALAILMATVIVGMMTARGPSPSLGAIRASAMVSGLGTLLMATVVSRVSPYPRWSLYGAAGILALSLLVSTVTTPDPAAWVRDTRQMAWMFPWFVMLFGFVGRATGKGWCAPAHPKAGWIMLVTAALLGGVASVSARLGSWL